MSEVQAPEAPAPVELAVEPVEEPKAERSPEDWQEEVRKLRKENASWRTKYREAEPIIAEHQAREEANKTELQKAQEALAKRDQDFTDLQTRNNRLELANIHHIPADDIDLIGSGTREEMEARAARLGALYTASAARPTPPPTDRPVEGLRPGATPEPPKPVDNSYPANWGFQPPQQT